MAINTKDIYPPLLDIANSLIADVNKHLDNKICFISSGFRSFKEQNAIYLQGRNTPGKIVTYAKGGESTHNHGLGFDIAFKTGNKLDWDIRLFKFAGQLSRKYNLEWGGDWKIKDYPHFQYKTMFDYKFVQKHLGKIFIAVEDKGKAYYISPKTMQAEFMGDTPAKMLKYVQDNAIGISNKDLTKLIK